MKIAIATIAIIVGILCLGGGVLGYFAGMMSDAPGEGNRLGRNGCVFAVIGVALVGSSIWWLV